MKQTETTDNVIELKDRFKEKNANPATDMTNKKNTRVLSIASGKGGGGKD